MKTSEIRDLMNGDIKMDMANLSEESLKTPNLHSKYYALMMIEIRTLKSMEMEWDKMYKQKFMYYLGKCPDEIYEEDPLDYKVNKSDLDIFMKADEELQALKKNITIQEMKVDMLQTFIKDVINQRNWQIRNAIEYLQFKEGVK